jgi:tetratricopeptide (TPR) repeat protein
VYLKSKTSVLCVQLLSLVTCFLPTSVFSYSVNNILMANAGFVAQNYISDPDLNELLLQGMEKGIQGDYQGAIADFTEVIRLSPNEVEAYYNRGIAYAKLNNYREAIADFNQALNLNQKIADIYVERGKVQLALGNREAAMADLKVAQKLFHQQKNTARYQEMENLLQDF